MIPVVTDEEGNTPLLKAAQPRTKLEREFALQKLEERIKAQTLVVTRYKKDNAEKMAQYRLPGGEGKSDQILEMVTGWDINIPFDILATNRAEFSRILQWCLHSKQNKAVCKNLAIEIIWLFIKGWIKTTPQDTYFNRVDELIKTKAKIKQIEDVYKTQSAIAKQSPNNSELNKALEELKSAYSAAKSYFRATYNLAIAEFSTEPMISTYLKTIETNHHIPIGLQAMLTFAKVTNKAIDFWEKQPDNTLKLLASGPQLKGSSPRINILKRTDYFIHNLLVKPDCIPHVENTILKLKRVDGLAITNNKGETLLHKAVTSTAADILVLYLLSLDENIMRNINLEVNGCTPLQYAITYFGRNCKQFTAEFGVIEYQKMFTTCLEALIASGADLNLMNSKKSSALDYARYYTAHLNEACPGFNIEVWLLITKNKYRPAIISSPSVQFIGEKPQDADTYSVVNSNLKLNVPPAIEANTRATQFEKELVQAESSHQENSTTEEVFDAPTIRRKRHFQETMDKYSCFPYVYPRQSKIKIEIIDTPPRAVKIDLTAAMQVTQKTCDPNEIFQDNPMRISGGFGF